MSVAAVAVKAAYADQSSYPQEERRIAYEVCMKKPFEEVRADLYHVIYNLVYRYTDSPPTPEPPAEFEHAVLKGGITNRLFVCRLSPHPPIIVRLFGAHSAAVIDRKKELTVAKFISSHGVGPRVYGTFLNGRLEGFIDGAVSLTPEQMLDRSISASVAVAVATIHSLPPVAAPAPAPASITAASAASNGCLTCSSPLSLVTSPLSTTASATSIASVASQASNAPSSVAAAAAPGATLWTTIEQWLLLALEAAPRFSQDPAKKATYESIDFRRMYREFVELKAQLSLLEEPVVFCHNDLLSGNILQVPPVTTDAASATDAATNAATNAADASAAAPSIALIDFEYSAPNFRAFDIANHFCECCGFDCHWPQFPDEAHQRAFLRTYLRAADALAAAGPSPAAGFASPSPSPFSPFPSARTAALDASAASLSARAEMPGSDVFEARVEVLRRRVMGFVLASHLFWSAWSCVMAVSATISFDYLGYSLLRANAYFGFKPYCTLSVKPLLQARAATAAAVHPETGARLLLPQRRQPVRAAVVGWGLAGKDLHPPSVAAAPGIVLTGVVARPRSDPQEQSDREQSILTRVKGLAWHFGEAGVPLETPDAAKLPVSCAKDGNGAPAPGACCAAGPCATSAREQERYDAEVTAKGVAWDMSVFADNAATLAGAAPGADAAAVVAAGRVGDDAAAAAAAAGLTTIEVDAASECVVYPSFEAALASSTVDLVIIASPPQTHEAYCRAALAAGKHVVCDKPWVPSSATARSLAALAEQEGRMLCIFQNRRFDGDELTLRRLLSERRLGRVKWAEFAWQSGLMRVSKPWTDIRVEEGGGRVWDLGAHCVDHAMTVFRVAAAAEAAAAAADGAAVEDRGAGRPVSVYARVLCEEAAHPHLDTHAHITITFADDAVAMVDVGGYVTIPKPKYLVVGDVATFAKSGMDTQEHALVAGKGGYTATEPAEEDATVRTRAGESSIVPTTPGRWPEYYAQVVRAIHGEGEAPVSIEDSILSVRIVEAALESALSGKAVAL